MFLLILIKKKTKFFFFFNCSLFKIENHATNCKLQEYLFDLLQLPVHFICYIQLQLKQNTIFLAKSTRSTLFFRKNHIISR